MYEACSPERIMNLWGEPDVENTSYHAVAQDEPILTVQYFFVVCAAAGSAEKIQQTRTNTIRY